MPFAVISRASSGEVVAAVTGKRIRVVSYVAVAAGAVTIEWRSATTGISGVMSLITGVPLVAPRAAERVSQQAGYFETAPGEALNLQLGGAVQVSGHLEYELLP